MASHPTHPQPLSRRRVLGIAGAAALAPALAACGGRDEAQKATGALTLATTTATPQDKELLSRWIGKFTKETGIKVTPRFYPDAQYQNALSLLFQGKDKPDVFRLVKQSGEMSAAYQKGWIQPLDGFDAITDLLGKEYPKTASDPVLSGLHIGKRQYGMPALVDRPWGSARSLMCNLDLLEKHGIDKIPGTWGELTDAAAGIAKDSGGKVAGYGLIGGAPDALNVSVYGLQNVAGPQMTDPAGTPVDYSTGRPGASHDSFVQAVGQLRGLAAEGALGTGWESLQPPQFFQQFASGKIAMALITSWWWAEIHKINPKLRLGFGPAPVPDSGRKGYGSIGNIRNPGAFQPYWGMTKGAGKPQDAAKLIAYLSGVGPQRDYYAKSGLVTALSGKYTDDLKAQDRKLLQVAKETERAMPNPLSRSAKAVDVLAAIAQRSPKPLLNETFLAAIRGKADYRKAAGTFDAKLEKVLAEELAKAGVDRDTFTFADWDPMKDYA